MALGYLGLRPSFAGTDALIPRVIKVCVTRTSTVFKPGTAATATTLFGRFLDGPTFVACGTYYRSRDCFCCIHVGIDLRHSQSLFNLSKHLCTYVISLELTFAGLDAIKPPVISVSVAGTSTVLIPSTARSATTDSAGFLERAALWARHLLGNGEVYGARTGWCGDWRANYY